MKYCSLRDLREYLQFTPIRVLDEKLGVGDGETRTFYTLNKPIVDPDYDGEVVDDVRVKVGGQEYSIIEVDKSRGMITLSSPPPRDIEIYSEYSWHPVSDEELVLAIEAAEAEIDAECCRSFSESVYEEKIYLHSGNTFSLTYTPVISIVSIVIESLSGEVVEKLTPEKYEFDCKHGIIYLKTYRAGVVSPPWYTPTSFYVRVRYTAGYREIPSIVKQTTLLLASYIILSRISLIYTSEPEYQGRISIAFKKPGEIVQRLSFLRSEVENMKKKLPRYVKVF